MGRGGEDRKREERMMRKSLQKDRDKERYPNPNDDREFERQVEVAFFIIVVDSSSLNFIVESELILVLITVRFLICRVAN
jgi:hypothetical protein